MKVLIINIIVEICIFIFTFLFFIHRDSGNIAMVFQIIVLAILQFLINLFINKVLNVNISTNRIFITLLLLLIVEIYFIATFAYQLREIL